ncbi:MAG: hypothetical protein ACI84C_001188 [Flavobacteriales bacterium]
MGFSAPDIRVKFWTTRCLVLDSKREEVGRFSCSSFQFEIMKTHSKTSVDLSMPLHYAFFPLMYAPERNIYSFQQSCRSMEIKLVPIYEVAAANPKPFHFFRCPMGLS